MSLPSVHNRTRDEDEKEAKRRRSALAALTQDRSNAEADGRLPLLAEQQLGAELGVVTPGSSSLVSVPSQQKIESFPLLPDGETDAQTRVSAAMRTHIQVKDSVEHEKKPKKVSQMSVLKIILWKNLMVRRRKINQFILLLVQIFLWFGLAALQIYKRPFEIVLPASLRLYQGSSIYQHYEVLSRLHVLYASVGSDSADSIPKLAAASVVHPAALQHTIEHFGQQMVERFSMPPAFIRYEDSAQMAERQTHDVNTWFSLRFRVLDPEHHVAKFDIQFKANETTTEPKFFPLECRLAMMPGSSSAVPAAKCSFKSRYTDPGFFLIEVAIQNSLYRVFKGIPVPQSTLAMLKHTVMHANKSETVLLPSTQPTVAIGKSFKEKLGDASLLQLLSNDSMVSRSSKHRFADTHTTRRLNISEPAVAVGQRPKKEHIRRRMTSRSTGMKHVGQPVERSSVSGKQRCVWTSNPCMPLRRVELTT